MLSIRALSKTYPNGVRALDGISLEIERGLFGLLGPNGAGKSSLMRTIATLQSADSGTIDFDGIDVFADPTALRRQLGYLPQEFGVYPRIGAAELLDHIAVLKGVSDAKIRHEQIDALLHLTNLDAVRHRAVASYSGGMKQRFGIAQALLGSPRLLIVDEPTAGLDPEERNRFHTLLSEIAEDRVVLLSTHIVEDVSNLCSRMAIIGNGRVLADGTPADLIGELRGRIWSRGVSQSEVQRYRESARVISAQMKRGETRVHILAESQPDEGFEAITPDLEDVYFAVLAERATHAERAVC
jgi:ABC-type multidrug transport system ATPase subunit